MMKSIIEAAKSFFGKLLGDALVRTPTAPHAVNVQEWLNRAKEQGAAPNASQQPETPRIRHINDQDIANLENHLNKLEAIDKIGVLALQSEFAKCIDSPKSKRPLPTKQKKAKSAGKKSTKKPVKKPTKKQSKKSKKTAKRG